MAQLQKVEATDGQTLFDLNFIYVPNTSTLLVFLNGQLLTLDEDYTESSSTQITLLDPAESGDLLVFQKITMPTSGQVIQDTTRAKGDLFTFRFIAPPGLSSVKISIYNDDNTPILVNQDMTEIPSTGVYKFRWLLANTGVYVGIIDSPQTETKSVTEVRVLPGEGTGHTIISNTAGVGRRC